MLYLCWLLTSSPFFTDSGFLLQPQARLYVFRFQVKCGQGLGGMSMHSYACMCKCVLPIRLVLADSKST